MHSHDGGSCLCCATAADLTTHHRVNRGMGGAEEDGELARAELAA
ncbi:hypothetical protein [Streptomyces camponoticapitis]|nr:hypothetical protein [Streptomyces camponoticapitis]